MLNEANKIALFFAGFPREAAIEGVRAHIEKFWERGLKDRLIRHVAHGGVGLDELVLEAVRRMQIEA